MTSEVEKGRLGQSFESFLQEQGMHGDASAVAAKRVIAWQLRRMMEEEGISKVEMARRLETSRAQLDRLLDPENESVTLGTLSRAARAVGRKLRLELA